MTQMKLILRKLDCFGKSCNKANVENESNVHMHYQPSKYVFLATAQLYTKNDKSQEITCRILLDSGSQINLVTKRFAKKLNVQSRTVPVNITGIGRMKKSATQAITMVLESKQTSYKFTVDAIILKEITTYQPLMFVNIKKWPIPKNVRLADPNFNHPQKVDLLIGAELYPHLMLNEKILMHNHLPVLQNTKLGWIVLGKLIAAQKDFEKEKI